MTYIAKPLNSQMFSELLNASGFVQINELYSLSEAVAKSAGIVPADRWFEANSLREVQQSLSACQSFP